MNCFPSHSNWLGMVSTQRRHLVNWLTRQNNLPQKTIVSVNSSTGQKWFPPRKISLVISSTGQYVKTTYNRKQMSPLTRQLVKNVSAPQKNILPCHLVNWLTRQKNWLICQNNLQLIF